MSERPTLVHATAALSAPPLEESVGAELPRISDIYKWAFEQAAHLRAGRFDRVDVLNVADEIESVGKSEFKSFASGLEIILLHMLKRDHQPSRRSRSWVYSILEHRRRVIRDLDDSPSLTSRRFEAIDRAYESARLRAARETKQRVEAFPEECAYTWEQIMEAPYALDEG